MTAERSVLFFDVMGTLVYNPFFKEIPAFFGLTHEQLLDLKDPTAWEEFERGEITEAEYFRRCFADGAQFDHQGFRACVDGAYRWVTGMEEQISELHARGYEIHALSNYPEWYQVIENKLRLSRYLEWSFVSCKTGIRKPSCEAYVNAASGVARPLEACLLIDDSLENCAGARAAGMPAVPFREAVALRRELIQRGIL
jgi:HAD superfamily hydrolase (TIGR01509 family)